MESVQETKARLLQEVVRDNVEPVRRHRSKRMRAAAKGIFPLWLWGCFLIGAFGYLFFMPAQVVSVSPTPPVENAEPLQAHLPAERAPAASEPEIPHGPPRQLDRAVFPLSVKKIVIDPGHGGGHTGAISESGVSEKEITLDIALRLKRLMEGSSFQPILTRQSDRGLSLEKRVAVANDNSADLFLSIHVNWMEPRRIRPLETYFVGPTDDPAVTKLVSLENQDSGYSLADYRQLLEKVYIHTRRDESRRLAETIHTELYYSLREINPGLHNRGVKSAPFVVLIGTQMPAILVEVSCLSNEEEVKLLTNEEYRERIAAALLRGVRSYAEGLNGSAKKGS